MATIIGDLDPAKKRGLLSAVAARLSESARLQAEAGEGAGLRKLLPLLEALPAAVTVILKPSIGFLSLDCCIVGPGKVLAIQTVHWTGPIKVGEKGQWLGSGAVDLGRPDRKASVFCDRVQFSGHARGFEVEPLVLFTAGSAQPPESMCDAPVLHWDAAAAYLRGAFPEGVRGFDPAPVINLLKP